MKDYHFDRLLSMYIHKGSRSVVCTRCLSSTIHSPLREITGGYKCHTCGEMYDLPVTAVVDILEGSGVGNWD